MYQTPLLTDFYSLSMTQGYFLKGINPDVVFDMFFRRHPFGGGYSIFAGISETISRIVGLKFSPDELEYLEGEGIFHRDFLEFLEGYRFTGDLHAFDEGSVVFPGEPLIRVETNLIEAQLIESLLLNQINHQTLIATKAARIYSATGGGKVMEFGLRRAQGVDGALSATRAAFIGGCVASSNTLAGYRYGIPATGTMAHSWVMAFDSELEAFRTFAEIYPDRAILLIDTYDTLKSGIENAIIVGLEMKRRGKRIGVRLDSGDLQYLSEQVRARLDHAGLEDALICVSNDLNEQIISQLRTNNAPIDLWGVGTELVTGGRDSSLTGVYKLVARKKGGEEVPTIKISDNATKIIDPGSKQVYRFYDSGFSPLGDLVSLKSEPAPDSGAITFNHPMLKYKNFVMENYQKVKPMLKPLILRGEISTTIPTLVELQTRAIEGINSLDPSYTRLINPHIYKVSLSTTLRDLKFRMIDELT